MGLSLTPLQWMKKGGHYLFLCSGGHILGGFGQLPHEWTDAIRFEERVLLLPLLLPSLIITLSRLGSLPACPVPQDAWLRVGSFPPQGIPDSEPRAERQTAPPCHSTEARC